MRQPDSNPEFPAIMLDQQRGITASLQENTRIPAIGVGVSQLKSRAPPTSKYRAVCKSRGSLHKGAVQRPLLSSCAQDKGQDAGCTAVPAPHIPALVCLIKRKCLPSLLLAGPQQQFIRASLECKLLLVYKKD